LKPRVKWRMSESSHQRAKLLYFCTTGGNAPDSDSSSSLAHETGASTYPNPRRAVGEQAKRLRGHVHPIRVGNAPTHDDDSDGLQVLRRSEDLFFFIRASRIFAEVHPRRERGRRRACHRRVPSPLPPCAHITSKRMGLTGLGSVPSSRATESIPRLNGTFG